MNFTRRLSILALGLVAFPLLAAPPVLTIFDPPGGQRGSTIDVAFTPTDTVKVWSSSPNVIVEPSKTKGKFAVRIAPDASPGVVWLRAFNDQGASNLRPFIVGNLPEIAEKSPQKIDVPACVINGKLSKTNEVDSFSMPMKKGQTLVASLLANRVLRSPMDAILQVVSADGFVLDQNHDFDGLDPQITYTVPNDGVYTVRVFCFPSQPDTSIRFMGGDLYQYRLILSREAFADHAMPLAVTKVKPSPVNIVGWNLSDDVKQLPVVGTPDDEDVVSLFHPKLPNSIGVRLEPHATWNATDAEFLKRTEPLATPFSLTGRIDKSNAMNVFPFVAKKGQPLLIEIESRTIGLSLTPVLRILDTTGKVLQRAEPSALDQDTKLTFQPPADGVYRIEVSDHYREGGPRFVYRLRVAVPQPDFALTVASDRFTITPGKPLEIPVTIVPTNGFKGDIALTAEGLPEGVKATVTKSDAKIITLQFVADKGGINAPFRIVGRTKTMPEVVRTARVKLADLDESLPYLWVHAPEKK